MNCSEFLPNINQLANLLKQDEGDSSDDDQPVNATAKLGPASIGPVKQKAPTNKAHSDAKKDSKDIWDVDEVEEGAEFEDLDDPRPQPEYDIVYKQAITTEDMFLQMGNKNPTTSSCEDMVVKINLPNTKKSDVDLNVTDKFLDIRSPKFKLGLHLPHPVDSKTGSAKWDADKELLIITLRMKREFDFINQ
ncbi:dynein axonemal assembly factor 6-like [Saccoglossus kowalevskii]|uniref:Protein PIH1D3-like n=1 Tax=Saccoglossus kowalevskii TaxID=10224 RepID=A0ABM0GKA8_SACKO|nr:PREDICTED: protein PIH1D3-like [Saccoglossus kowalevskii]